MIKLTVEIAAAYLEHNTLPANEIPNLIHSIYATLIATSSPEQVVETPPAVSVRKSVTPEAIICLDCGRKFSMLKRHLRTDHDTTPDEYRAKWGLPITYPMVAPEYAARRSVLAVKIGLGHKPRKAATVAPVVAEKRGRGRKKAAAA
jgi:predicted transcriptional regulator